jgi:SpoU rRNA methylase family enzyme
MRKIEVDPQAEAEQINVHVAVMKNSAAGLAITTDDDLRDATKLLTNVKALAKQLKAKKSAILDPLKEAMKQTKDLFKPAEDELSSIEQTVKQLMVTYHSEREAAAAKQAASIERRMDKGTMKVETGMAKLANLDQPDATVQTEGGSAQFREGPQKVRVLDPAALVAARPSLLTRERVMEALRLEVAAEIKAGAPIPEGVEVYRDKVVAGIAN